MQLRAFAKINLELRILGKRPDGFHELRTVFQTIDWFDEIEIAPSERFAFSASQGPQDETNLVVRAVRVFEQEAKRVAHVAVRLTKNVPSGAGLGGGSSDAAATYLALHRFYGEPVRSDLMSSLGSDVPFFLFGGRALGTGRGDHIQTLDDVTGYCLVLVNPSFAIPTGQAYSWLTTADKSNKLEGLCVHSVSDRDSERERNDFEEPVFARYPELQAIRNDLLRYGATRAALSGSGSTVFGKFHSPEAAAKAESALGSRYAVKVTRPLSRAEYFSRMFI